MIDSLSAEAYFWRFLGGRAVPPPAWMLARLLAGGADRGAWVAQAQDVVIGHSCWTRGPDGAAEIGVVVRDCWQRRGIGTALVGATAAAAAAAGADRARFEVHPENRFVVAVMRRRAVGQRPRLVDGLIRWDVPLTGPGQTHSSLIAWTTRPGTRTEGR